MAAVELDHLVGIASSMPELLTVLRARRDELGLTHERIDALAGWPDGYAGKLLAPQPIKNLGWMSLGVSTAATRSHQRRKRLISLSGSAETPPR